MGSFGKWIGGGLGFIMAGPLGAVLGFLAGSMIDNTTIQTSTYTGSPRSTAPGDFAMSLLVLIAAVMKADGKVLKSELDYVKAVFCKAIRSINCRRSSCYAKGHTEAEYSGTRRMRADQ